MKARINRLALILKTAPRKKLLALAALIIVALAIPFTVIVSQQQQNLKQNAAQIIILSCPLSTTHTVNVKGPVFPAQGGTDTTCLAQLSSITPPSANCDADPKISSSPVDQNLNYQCTFTFTCKDTFQCDSNTQTCGSTKCVPRTPTAPTTALPACTSNGGLCFTAANAPTNQVPVTTLSCPTNQKCYKLATTPKPPAAATTCNGCILSGNCVPVNTQFCKGTAWNGNACTSLKPGSVGTCQSDGTFSYSNCASGIVCRYSDPNHAACDTTKVCSASTGGGNPVPPATAKPGTTAAPTPATPEKVCVPNSQHCNGNVPETCNSAGTAYVPGNTCGANKCQPDYGYNGKTAVPQVTCLYPCTSTAERCIKVNGETISRPQTCASGIWGSPGSCSSGTCQTDTVHSTTAIPKVACLGGTTSGEDTCTNATLSQTCETGTGTTCTAGRTNMGTAGTCGAGKVCCKPAGSSAETCLATPGQTCDIGINNVCPAGKMNLGASGTCGAGKVCCRPISNAPDLSSLPSVCQKPPHPYSSCPTTSAKDTERYWSKYADVLIPGTCRPDKFGQDGCQSASPESALPPNVYAGTVVAGALTKTQVASLKYNNSTTSTFTKALPTCKISSTLFIMWSHCQSGAYAGSKADFEAAMKTVEDIDVAREIIDSNNNLTRDQIIKSMSWYTGPTGCKASTNPTGIEPLGEYDTKCALVPDGAPEPTDHLCKLDSQCPTGMKCTIATGQCTYLGGNNPPPPGAGGSCTIAQIAACALQLKTCSNGVCVGGGTPPPATGCTDGTFKCAGNNVQVCANGTFGPLKSCTSTQTCNAGTGNCDGDNGGGGNSCTNGTFQCAGQALQACSPDGAYHTLQTCNATQTCNNKGSCDNNGGNPGNIKLNYTIGLDGIGNTGDNLNPNPVANSDSQFRSNINPAHPNRDVVVQVYDANNNLVDTQTGTGANYDSASGKFKGTVTLKQGIVSGSYRIFIKSTGYLRKGYPTIVNLTNNQPLTLPLINLTTGDVDNNTAINILDYNILFSCSIFSKDNGTICKSNADYKVRSNLNDNNIVDHDDLQLFLREFAVQNSE